jgi:uncharacterized protein
VLKAILLILAIVLAYWFFWGRKRTAARNDTRPNEAPAPERMVICAYCGLHVPEGECIAAAGRHYCSDEHRRLGTP